MCYWQAAIIAAQTASSIGSQASQTKAMRKAIDLNNKQEVQQNNIANANMRNQQIDMMMNARAELTQLNVEQQQALGALNASFGESGLEGRSFDRVKNAMAISSANKKGEIRYNLEKDFAGMYAEAIGNHISMEQRIRNRESQMPSRTQQAWGIFGSAAQGAGQMYGAYQANQASNSKTSGGSKGGKGK